MNLLSASPNAAPPPPIAASHSQIERLSRDVSNFGLVVNEQFVNSSLRLICREEIDGRRTDYFTDLDNSRRFKKSSIHAVSLQSPQAPVDGLISFVRSYVVPEGFPYSVTPSYVPYMIWRALKHFFGGAMGVFTTQALLRWVGAFGNSSPHVDVAINRILKVVNKKFDFFHTRDWFGWSA